MSENTSPSHEGFLKSRNIRRAVIVAAVLIAGCSSGAEQPTETSLSSMPFEPVTVNADNGQVTIEQRPQAIVSLSPSLTEMLYAVGAGDQVMAVDKSSDYPAGTPVTDISGFRPNVEAVIALEPDLILLGRDRDGAVEKFNDVGIPVVVLESAPDLEDVYRQIGIVGDVTGHSTAAASVVAEMRREIDQLVSSVEIDDRLTYYYELSNDYGSLTSDTFVGSVMTMLGLDSIADGVDDAAGGFLQLTAEYVLLSDPDLVFIAHADGGTTSLDDLTTRPGWSTMKAVTNGNVVILDTDIASRWGPRVVELVAAVVNALGNMASG